MEVTVSSPSKQGFAPYLDLIFGGGETEREMNMKSMFYNPLQKPKLLAVSSKHFIHNSWKFLKLNVICNISIFPFLYTFTLTTLTIQTHLLLHKYRHHILLSTQAPHLYHTQSLHLLGYPATPTMLPGTRKPTPVSITVHSI